jgi:hypothetical protein
MFIYEYNLTWFFSALDLVRKLRLTQGLDIKEEDEYEEGGEKDQTRNKILSIMDQVTVSLYRSFLVELVKHSNCIICLL